MRKLVGLLCIAILSAGCSGSETVNDKQVEILHSRLVAGKYQEIYDLSYDGVKKRHSSEEFVSRITEATVAMREFDETLKWEKLPRPRTDFFNDPQNSSFRIMEKDGNQIMIEMWWATDKLLCAFEISKNFGSTPNFVVVRACA